jgi:peptidoglycan/xylan/chitin deacetylase (PgdA/CDA1 family)
VSGPARDERLERFSYSPIVQRPRLDWPDENAIAVYVAPNVEVYELLPPRSLHRDPWPRSPHPDVLGYGTRDFGNRVGFWRLLELMDRHEIRCTVSLNVALCDHFPDIFAECEARGWDYMGHGLYNTRYLYGLSAEEEAAVIADCVETFRRLTGRQLRGWLSPAVTFSERTADLVAAAGISYYCDLFHDDQPCPVWTETGRLTSLPYSMDVNDAVLYRTGHEADELYRIIKDQFDVLYREGMEGKGGRVLCIAVHPYVSGQPHRVDYLDRALSYVLGHEHVWMATGSEIVDWFWHWQGVREVDA